MNIGLFFGSFNPIHTGHLIIANIMVETTELEEVWFVVSPHNPFKKRKSLLHEFDRMDMVNQAIYDNYKLRASDVEFSMPKPSYTIDTLTYLDAQHANKRFSLILGADNLSHFRKWKNADVLLENYSLFIYPRPGVQPSELIEHPNVKMVEAPMMDISATFIRKCIKSGFSVKYLVHDAVEQIIKAKSFYR
ncbi:MAG: nicotinate (nicotinamide) nucleotide adenylyltransferase [Bacteroidota bacterium]